MSMLVRRLGEVIADRAGRAPASLLGLPVRDWCGQIQHAVHRRRGRLPAATTMKNIRCLLTRLMRMLVIASDPGPWWQRDRWNPFEDYRIPLREHEPMGRSRCGSTGSAPAGCGVGCSGTATGHPR
ncbi:hypothetical protein [Rhodococcus sp. NPDC057529]|uniref:hypothetical protein n=1 Tax=Rhodococcus sp. NPDC057529 TaxID=3346158 RepID=UPI00366C4078